MVRSDLGRAALVGLAYMSGQRRVAEHSRSVVQRDAAQQPMAKGETTNDSGRAPAVWRGQQVSTTANARNVDKGLTEISLSFGVLR